MQYTPLRGTGLIARPALPALAAAIALALIVALPASRVSAHAAYDHSTPDDGEVVAEAPAQIQVFFGQEVSRSGGLPTLEVVNDSGDLVSSNAVLSDDDRTMMTADLNPGLPDGRYAIIWHTISAEDGEEAKGAAFFYVGEGPSATEPAGKSGTPTARPTATEAPSPKDEEDSSEVPVWALIASVVGGLTLGAGGGLIYGRRK